MHSHKKNQYKKKHHKKFHQHSNKTLDIDNYAVNSGLASINPNLKVLVSVISLFCCLLSFRCITACMIATVMTLITWKRGKIQGRVYGHMLMIPSSFILLSAIVLLVDISPVKLGFIDIPIFSGYLSITRDTMDMAVSVSIKAFCCITCLYMISLSTPLYEVISVLKRCKVPNIMISLMYLIYRYIFILLEAFYHMNTSAGARLGYCNIKRSYRSFFGICSNLLVVAFKKASSSFDAMEARCYDGKLGFLERDKVITGKQVFLLSTYFLVIFVVLMVERNMA